MSATPPETYAAVQRIPLPEPFRLHAGGQLSGAFVAVETWGTLARDRRNAILVFTGLSASSHAASSAADPAKGWWEGIVGPGRALDTDRWFVICVNSLGSCYGSTGPGDADPATGEPYHACFPELRVEDIAAAGQAAVEHFAIAQLAAVIGPSLGGMTAVAHATLYPGRARTLVSISGALAANASAIATRSLQREILGSALHGGAPRAQVEQAMRWARKIGVLSYVGSALLQKRFAREQNEPFAGHPSGTDFEVESWLEHLARKFVRTFDPWSYWYVSRAMDLYDFALHGGGDRARAAARLKLERALVIGVHEDLLFPLEQQREMASTLSAAGIPTQFAELHSPYGHDAFLVEDALFTPLLGGFLAREAAALEAVRDDAYATGTAAHAAPDAQGYAAPR